MPWVGRDLQRPSSPNPCSEQGHLQQTRLLRSPSSLALNLSRDGASTTGQPVPGSHHPHCKKFLPHIQSKQEKLERKGSGWLASGTGGEENNFRDILGGWGKRSQAGEDGSTVVRTGVG